MTAEPILEINELTVEFKSRGAKSHRALDGVSLSLPGGGVALAIVGDSGSGKSTLLRSAIGLIPPKSGSVRLFGKELNGAPARELTALRRRCGYVPQDPYGALPPGLSVIDAVMEPEIIAGIKRAKAERRERAKELLAEFGLTDERIFASRAVGLSGGQRQRVELARALMLGPELLLCDEKHRNNTGRKLCRICRGRGCYSFKVCFGNRRFLCEYQILLRREVRPQQFHKEHNS